MNLSLLVTDPKRYVMHYLGFKNSNHLEVAIEIFLADKVLDPKFLKQSLFEKVKVLDGDIKSMYLDVNPNNLKSLYYFNYMDFVVSNLSLDEEMSEVYSVYVANEILRNTHLKSVIAKNMLKSNDFYKTLHRKKLDVIDEEDKLEKVMGLIMLHNKELYRLEKERMKNLEEYKVFEQYKDEILKAERCVFSLEEEVI